MLYAAIFLATGMQSNPAPLVAPPEPTPAPFRPSLLGWLSQRRQRLSHWHWGGLGLEVVAIFMGITMSFLFDEWREERQDRERERILLEKLVGEIDIKLEELQSDANEFDRLSGRVRTLIGYTRDLELPDSIRKNLQRVVGFSLGTTYFQPNTPAYMAMNNTEGNRLMKDTAVTRQLFNTYENSFISLNLAYQELERVKHGQLADVFRRRSLYRVLYDEKDLRAEEVDQAEVKSMLLVLLMQMEGLSRQCNATAENCLILRNQIRKRLKHLRT